jgi:hypothetical protein
MVESVKIKAEGSVFSIKKGIILSDLNPGFKLPHESFGATLGEQIVDGKRGQSPFSFDISWKKITKNGDKG